MLDNMKGEGGGSVDKSDLLGQLEEMFGVDSTTLVWEMDVEPLLEQVDSLIAHTLGSTHMSQTDVLISKVVEQLEPLVVEFVKQHGKSTTAIGRWLVYGKCVEHVGVRLCELVNLIVYEK